MNIFYVDKDPYVAARSLCDKHVTKMVLETAQLLSTAHHVIGSDQDLSLLYKKTHVNHPSAKWVRECGANYDWTYLHFVGLLNEYEHRYLRRHASARLLSLLDRNHVRLEHGYFTDPPQCMPDQYKSSDAVSSYRDYYNGEKSHMFRWTRREAPKWMVRKEENVV